MKYHVKIDNDGEYWYKHGTDILHREAGAAYIHVKGYKAWWQDNKKHREVGPAIIYVDGTRYYWVKGELVK